MMDETPIDGMKLITGDASQPDVEHVAVRNGKNRRGSHHDVQHLGRRIRHLQHILSGLADKEDFEALIDRIDKHGYATVAEFTLVEGLIESMHEQANTLAGLKQLVTEASYTILGDWPST